MGPAPGGTCGRVNGKGVWYARMFVLLPVLPRPVARCRGRAEAGGPVVSRVTTHAACGRIVSAQIINCTDYNL